MQLNRKLFKLLYAALLCVGSVSISSAQNTDISQGVKAPANVKVDGKHTEWGAALPAYNKSTTLRYTLANDANNLYLAITCTDNQNINKLLGGGLTFTINKDGKKKEKDAVVIEYPMAGRGGGGMRGMRMGGGRGSSTVDTAALVAGRKQTVAAAKELSITGVKDITDTLVSIYNTYGIKTGITFDTRGNMFYELAIPLSLLELSADKATELAYNLKLNGMQFNMRGDGGGGRQGGGGNGGGNGGGFGGGGGGITISGNVGGSFMDMMTPTDFWAKYKLAKP